MRHLFAGKKLNRTVGHRRAMRRNLAAALILHKKIVTTLPKAKDCRPFVEKLITRAKKGTVHDRRIIAADLNHTQAEQVLFKEVAEMFRTRQGGYTSIHRLSRNRLRDDAPMAVIELVTWAPGEKGKGKKKKAQAQPQEQPVAKPADGAQPAAK